MFSYLDHLECTQCGKTFSHAELHKTSPCCGKVLFARYDLPRLRRDLDRRVFASRPDNMWRFSELLPVLHPENVLTLGEGGTPLLKAGNLAKKLGLSSLFIREEGLNPTGSFKARGIAAAGSNAQALGSPGFTNPPPG